MRGVRRVSEANRVASVSEQGAKCDVQLVISYDAALAEANRLAPKGTSFYPILTGLIDMIYKKQ